MTISLCMIVKNEENNLGKCLESVHDLFDEINIVDTGSTDKTIEIARKYTARIFHFDWINDFAAARNFSFSKATKDYIMWLDADDIMMNEDREKFKKLAANLNPTVDAVIMDYKYYKDQYGNVLVTQKRERLIKRSRNYQWKNKIHEAMDIDYESHNVITADIAIDHEHYYGPDTDNSAKLKRNFEILEEIIKSGDESPRHLRYYAGALYLNGDYENAEIYIKKFLDIADEFSLKRSISIYIQLHNIYLIKKDYENAYLILALNEKRLSHFSEFYCALGDFSFNILQDYEIAINYYKKALNCSGVEEGGILSYQNERYYYYTPYERLGMSCVNLGRKEEALKHYKKALEYAAISSDYDKVNQTIKSLS